MKKFLVSFFVVITAASSSCQTEKSQYDRIFNAGDKILQMARKGDFSYFTKNHNDEKSFPTDSLELYKEDLNSGALGILELRSIEPSKKESTYLFHSLVYNYKKTKPADYYYVAILLIHDDGRKAEVVNSWIMTEMEAFKSWWMSALVFFESEEFKKIPEKYRYESCPPPPQ